MIHFPIFLAVFGFLLIAMGRFTQWRAVVVMGILVFISIREGTLCSQKLMDLFGMPLGILFSIIGTIIIFTGFLKRLEAL